MELRALPWLWLVCCCGGGGGDDGGRGRGAGPGATFSRTGPPSREREAAAFRCGGCWAFSVVGAVESACAIKGEPLEDLSVQQVIDCSYSNYGCNGGSTLSALNWLNKMQVKLVKDSEYPFKAQNGLCQYFSISHSGFSIKGYSAYDFSDREDEMAKALLTFGPLIVVVDAVSWQDYLGGVIQHHCSSGEANHAVLVTGFDTTGSTPYWIVRNSWGSSWGVDGYAHVKMGANICGIADSVSAVFV
ncbi:cathepsin O isoform X2 [Elephas maximus indicus]|uniref:cathepsin O isoform X2 n=1 Tax=Elephas maximus indicus TaxID=99487 RepID=UPI002115EF22|nr:cathepsin O isoform X2 [Elephas maximus indicus]